MLKLLVDRRFVGLFWTQFLGAFNDNFFKNALVILTLYELAGEEGPMLVTAAAGIFIAPFFLFSATAGALADRFDKAMLTRRLKEVEIAVMLAGAAALWLGSIPALLVILFAMGAQSAFFSPIKYGSLPQLLARERLMNANALIEAATFLAILTGTIAGGLIVLTAFGVPAVMAGIVGLAALGRLTAALVPSLEPASPELEVLREPVRETLILIRRIMGDGELRPLVLCISWFWFIGAVVLAQVPAFTKEILNADERVVTLFLTTFTLGIGAGSALVALYARGRVDLRLVPFAALGITLFLVDLYFAARGFAVAGDQPLGILAFLSEPAAWRILGDLVAVACAGGIYVVPLFTALQVTARDGERARVIAGLNIASAGFMVASALLTLVLQAAGLDVASILLCLGIANLAFWPLSRRCARQAQWRPLAAAE